MNWQEIELLGYAYFAKKGYRILVPLVKNDGFDFCIEKDGIFKKINVKVAGLKTKIDPNSWSISQASGAFNNPRKKHPVDIYLAWIPYKKEFLELDGLFFGECKSKSRIIPKYLLQKKG